MTAAAGLLEGRLLGHQPLLKGAREDDRVVHRRWLLEHDVEPKGIAEACDENMYLLRLGDGHIPAGEGHEPLRELVH
jgi:hypothetical protein